MKAIVVRETGEPSVMQVDEHPLGPVGPTDAHVQLAYAGVNFLDTHHRSGIYQRPLPFVPGREGSGVVIATGAEVSHVEPGDRVAFAMHNHGTYAEEAVIPAWKVAPVPDGVELRDAASIMLQGLTALSLVEEEAGIQPGQTVLVHSIAGGTGSLIAQVAVHDGARVLGFASTPEKVEAARATGAHELATYPSPTFDGWVRDHTDGRGADVIFDAVGGPTFAQDLDSLAVRGRLIVYGRTGGAFEAFDPARLADGCLSLTYSRLSFYVSDFETYQARAARLMSLADQGAMRPLKIHEWPLKQAPQAHEALGNRSTIGKHVISVMEGR